MIRIRSLHAGILFLALAASGSAQAPPEDSPADAAEQPVYQAPAGGTVIERVDPEDPEIAAQRRDASARIEALAEEAARATIERKWDIAVENYAIWLEMEPINPVVRMRLGTALLRAGRPDEARPHLERAVMIEPRMADAWSALGLVYSGANEGYLALSSYARAVHLEPTQVRHRLALAVALNARGWSDAAESELRSAIAIDSESAEAHFNLAVLYMARTPPARAMARGHYRESLRLGGSPDESLSTAIENPDTAEADSETKE